MTDAVSDKAGEAPIDASNSRVCDERAGDISESNKCTVTEKHTDQQANARGSGGACDNAAVEIVGDWNDSIKQDLSSGDEPQAPRDAVSDESQMSSFFSCRRETDEVADGAFEAPIETSNSTACDELDGNKSEANNYTVAEKPTDQGEGCPQQEDNKGGPQELALDGTTEGQSSYEVINCGDPTLRFSLYESLDDNQVKQSVSNSEAVKIDAQEGVGKTSGDPLAAESFSLGEPCNNLLEPSTPTREIANHTRNNEVASVEQIVGIAKDGQSNDSTNQNAEEKIVCASTSGGGEKLYAPSDVGPDTLLMSNFFSSKREMDSGNHIRSESGCHFLESLGQALIEASNSRVLDLIDCDERAGDESEINPCR
jgi:hypothetical protein